MKSFPKMGGISAPPLFIEEVAAKQTEEFFEDKIPFDTPSQREFNLKSKIIKSKISKASCGWNLKSKIT